VPFFSDLQFLMRQQQDVCKRFGTFQLFYVLPDSGKGPGTTIQLQFAIFLAGSKCSQGNSIRSGIFNQIEQGEPSGPLPLDNLVKEADSGLLPAETFANSRTLSPPSRVRISGQAALFTQIQRHPCDIPAQQHNQHCQQNGTDPVEQTLVKICPGRKIYTETHQRPLRAAPIAAVYGNRVC
jgi:hypothetical protein